MDFQASLKKIESSSCFKEWKKKNPQIYLVHFFSMGDTLQIGYYDKSSDKITTFTDAEEITCTTDAEIFKEKKSVPELKMTEVSLSLDDAKEIAYAVQKEDYGNDMRLKEILVLQTIDKNSVYNMTFVTNTFKLINIRIDAKTKKVIKKDMRPLMDLAQTIQKGGSQ